ncbi:MAG: hypothetical protein WBF17_17330, partial [Phycisphaerae bacterium]
GSALFGLTVDDAVVPVEVTVSTARAGSINDLVEDLNEALETAGIGELVAAVILDDTAVLRTLGAGPDSALTVHLPNSIARNVLGLSDGQAATGEDVAGSTTFANLTIDNPNDVDWYSLRLVDVDAAGSIAIRSASSADNLEARLYRLNADDSITEVRNNTGATLQFTPDATEMLIAETALTDWTLASDLMFDFVINGASGSPISVAVLKSDTLDNDSLVELLADLTNALEAAGLADDIVVDRLGQSITFRPTPGSGINALMISGAEPLGFAADQAFDTMANAYPLDPIAGISSATGLTIGSDVDEDWFRFALEGETLEQLGIITLDKLTPDSALRMEVRDGNGATLLSAVSGAGQGSVTIDLADMPEPEAGDYFLWVGHDDPATNSEAARYELAFDVGEGGEADLDLAGVGVTTMDFDAYPPIEPGVTYYLRVASPDGVPTSYDVLLDTGDGAEPAEVDYAVRYGYPRRDIILGGTGHDRLSGGMFEDWIFGQSGNDVLTGGEDYQASDLLFGGEGNDTFQVIPTALGEPGSDIGPLTLNDRFDGGEGEDRVLFLGGDTDHVGRPVPDWVAIRFSRFLSRYEITSLVWDVDNQEFMTDDSTVVQATIIAGDDAPADGQLSAPADFAVSVDGETAIPMTVPIHAGTPEDPHNESIKDLVDDLNEARGPELADLILFDNVGTRLTISAIAFGVDVAIETEDPVTEDEMHFADGQWASGVVEAYVQHYSFYQPVNVERTVIDTQGGDDVVRGDPEYMFPLADGTGVVYSEWGIKAGNYQEGARIGALEIHGGEGNDRLFGTYLADWIYGDTGVDFIAGGPGDDYINGGPGNDILLGNSGVEPDRFEFVTRDGEDAANDSLVFAALTGGLNSGEATTIGDLTFNLGDRGDWYVIPTPTATHRFGECQAGFLTGEMIEGIEFLDEYGNADTYMQELFDHPRWDGTNYYLFAAEIDDPSGELSLLPVEHFTGVPDYYMLHVINPKSFGIRAVAPIDTENIPGGMMAVDFTIGVNGMTSEEVAILVTDTSTITSIIGDESTIDTIKYGLAHRYVDESDPSMGNLSDWVDVFDDHNRIVLTLKKAGEIRIDFAIPSNAFRLGYEDAQDNLGPVDPMGGYRVKFTDEVGAAVDIPADGADLNVDPSDPAAKAALIPLGNINYIAGVDEYGDFIAAVRDTVGTYDDFLATPTPIHPQEMIGPSYATIVFGSEGGDVTPDATNSVRLQLPAPVLTDSFGTQSKFASGDYNGDNITDLAVLVSSVPSAYTGWSDPYAWAGLYVLFGREHWPETINLIAEADAVITGFDEPSSIASPGDLNDDNYDDLVVGARDGGAGKIYLFTGGPDVWSNSGVVYHADFEDGDAGGFAIDNAIGADVDGLWHLSTGRSQDPLHSGEGSFDYGVGEGPSGGGNYNVGHSAGRITLAAFIVDGDLNLANFEFIFNYYLDTERRHPGGETGYDVATFLLSADSGNTFTPIASNDDVLEDPTGERWYRATFTVGTLQMGDRIKVRFEFDSVDGLMNNYEGWYLDDMLIRATLDAEATAAVTFTDAYSVHRIGDVNADGYVDFAAIRPGGMTGGTTRVFFVEGGDPLPPGGRLGIGPYTVLDFGADRLWPTVQAIGRLNGDSAHDFILRTRSMNGQPHNYFVFGDAGGVYTSSEIADRWVVALGDINADGLGDLGSPIEKVYDSLDEDGTFVSQKAFEVFYTDDRDWTHPDAFSDPDLILEPGRPEYGDSAWFHLQPGGLEAVGDVNGDGYDDFGLADRLGGQTHVFFGRRLRSPYVDPSEELPPRPFEFELAKPEMGVLSDRAGLDFNVPGTPDVHDAFGLAGETQDDRLAGSQYIGDFNRDKYDDFLVWGEDVAYIVYGPVLLDDMEDVRPWSEIRIDLSGLGTVQRGFGDLDGDMLDDLVFIRHDTVLGELIGSVIWGSYNPPRELSAADADILFYIDDSGMAVDPDMQIAMLNWDGDELADLMVYLPSAAGNRYGGVLLGTSFNRGDPPLDLSLFATDMVLVRDMDDTNDILNDLFGTTTDYTIYHNSDDSELAIADINADGLDDLLLALPEAYDINYLGQPLGTLGRMYVLEGGSMGFQVVADYFDAKCLVQDFGLGAGVFAVGDVNRDGYGDFALASASEGVEMPDGSVFVFYGSADAVPSGDFPGVPFRAADAGVIVRRVPAGALPGNTAIGGPIEIAAGDFDASGMIDLAIGQPVWELTEGYTVLDRQDRGVVHVIWDVAELGGEIVLEDGPVDLDGDGLIDMTSVQGQTEGDEFGILPGTVGINLDADRYHDLLIGSPFADVLGPAVKQDAGKIYAAYGSPRRIELPTSGIIELMNHTFTGIGDVLINPATGRPVTFTEDPVYPNGDFTIYDNDDVNWYRFTTAGDGMPGNSIRVLPGAYDDRVAALEGPAGYLSAWFGMMDDTYEKIFVGSMYDSQGIFEMDLSRFPEQLGDPDTIDKVELRLTANIRADIPIWNSVGLIAGDTKAYFFDYLSGDYWLWVTDGTVLGTQRVLDTPFDSVATGEMVTLGDTLLFVAWADEVDEQLWISDGTPGGTQRLSDFGDDPEIGHLTAFKGRAFFDAYGPAGRQLYEVNDLGPGFQVIQRTSESTGFEVVHMTADINNLYISRHVRYRRDPVLGEYHEYSLWRMDGAFNDPVMLDTFLMPSENPDDDPGLLVHSAFMGGRLYFAAARAVFGRWYTEIYKVSVDTVETLQRTHTGWGNPKGFAGVDGLMFFVANGLELWQTRSAAGQATRVEYPDLFASVPSSDAMDPIAVACDDMVILLAEGIHDGFFVTRAFALTVDPGYRGVVTDIAARPIHYDSLVAYGEYGLFELNGQLFLTDGTERGTSVLYSGSASGLDEVVILGAEPLFLGLLPPLGEQSTLWAVEGNTATPIVYLSENGGLVTVELLDEEGDSIVTMRDGFVAGTTADTFTVTPAYGVSQTIAVDLTSEVIGHIQQGHKLMTVRVSSDPHLWLEIDRPDPDANQPTGLRFERQHGVVMDVFDHNGGLMYEGLKAADMRWLEAGRYYLRVYNPGTGQTRPMEIAVEINPPFQGRARYARDLDEINGSDGDDVIVGSDHLDHLYGQSGEDMFLAETVEVRDLAEYEHMRGPDAADRLVSNPRVEIDPVLNDVFVDPALIRAIAEKLDVPIFEIGGQPYFALPVHCSEMNTIVRLDLSGLWIS